MLAAACLLVGGSRAPHADADEKTVIRYATIAPAASAFGKILKAWGRSLSKETEGRVEFRYYAGGSQGDERDFIRKMRAGQMDAAGVTTIGLGIVVRPVLVLSAPGVIETYEQLDRVRDKMNERFAKMFDSPRCLTMRGSSYCRGRTLARVALCRRPQSSNQQT
ncbi:MAG: TRAP transporter substrate-binding protein DctP [Deltaproteobacteria bacterium]|nr:TRAP transporter substrate-binding protein DctP [Deltaproteobacteria bacterium]